METQVVPKKWVFGVGGRRSHANDPCSCGWASGVHDGVSTQNSELAIQELRTTLGEEPSQ